MVKAGSPRRDLHLHVDVQHLDALEGDGADARDHACEISPDEAAPMMPRGPAGFNNPRWQSASHPPGKVGTPRGSGGGARRRCGSVNSCAQAMRRSYSHCRRNREDGVR